MAGEHYNGGIRSRIPQRSGIEAEDNVVTDVAMIAYETVYKKIRKSALKRLVDKIKI